VQECLDLGNKILPDEAKEAVKLGEEDEQLFSGHLGLFAVGSDLDLIYVVQPYPKMEPRGIRPGITMFLMCLPSGSYECAPCTE
jgi:hypothetical protein